MSVEWPLPRTRGDGPPLGLHSNAHNNFAPHTRGWSLGCFGYVFCWHLCPAHAGMVPTIVGGLGFLISLPRTRGDGPTAPGRTNQEKDFAPHTRGWSRYVENTADRFALCPAHAGMVQIQLESALAIAPLPRTRGDGPQELFSEPLPVAFAPHTRGWSAARYRPLF